jgi:hypothetical protein
VKTDLIILNELDDIPQALQTIYDLLWGGSLVVIPSDKYISKLKPVSRNFGAIHLNTKMWRIDH